MIMALEGAYQSVQLSTLLPYGIRDCLRVGQ